MMDDAVTKAYIDSVMGASGANVNPIISTTGTSSGHLTINPAYSLHIGPGLSSKEEVELKELQLEHEKLLRQKRIQMFKNMPASFRQFIVDTINVNDFVSSLKSATVDDSELVEKISQLKSRDSRFHLSGHYGEGIYLSVPYQLLELISVEELRDAHATQTLEEELSASTDSINKHE
jgi:hypothetical protein